MFYFLRQQHQKLPGRAVGQFLGMPAGYPKITPGSFLVFVFLCSKHGF